MSIFDRTIGTRGPSRFVGAALLWWLALVPRLAAQSNSSTFVTRGDRGRDVLQVVTTLDTPSSMSFDTARVTITPTQGPSTADRDLTVIFSAKAWSNMDKHIAFRKSVRLAEGQAVLEVEFPQYQVSGQSSWDLTLYEDGRDIEDRRGSPKGGTDFQWILANEQTYQYAALMGSSETANDVRANLLALTASFQPGQAGLRNEHIVALNAASLDWRQYLPYCLWSLSARTVNDIVQTRPELAEVLRHYVASGGILLVYNAANPADQSAVEKLLNNTTTDLWSTIKYASSPWWIGSEYSRRARPSRNNDLQIITTTGADSVNNSAASTTEAAPIYEATGATTNSLNLIDSGSNGAEALAAANGANTLSSDFVASWTEAKQPESTINWRGIIFDASLAAESWGKLKFGGHADNLLEWNNHLDIDTDNLFINSQRWLELRNQWISQVETEKILSRPYLNGFVLVTPKQIVDVPPALLNHAQQLVLATPTSLAIATSMDGDWFWRNLISAVGKPPVWIFCGIVTLFGALLGPGLLLLTGRIKRRSLMILLVPCVSFLATLSIIAYGVLHEGFETYMRITSVQFIDPDTGTGFAWSRQNFFSGLPPRGGLNFAWDTYVRPVKSEDSTNFRNVDPRGADCVVTLGEQQNWQGWLKARQQQQLLVGHALKNAKFPVSVARGAAAGTIEVTNLTRSTIPLLVLRGERDSYYFLESLPPEATATVESRDYSYVSVNAGRVMTDYRPEPPPELSARGSLSQLGSRRGNTAYSNKQPDIIHNTFARYLSERCQLPNYGIAAVLTESDQVEIPLACRAEENLHVVIGAKPW